MSSWKCVNSLARGEKLNSHHPILLLLLVNTLLKKGGIQKPRHMYIAGTFVWHDDGSSIAPCVSRLSSYFHFTPHFPLYRCPQRFSPRKSKKFVSFNVRKNKNKKTKKKRILRNLWRWQFQEFSAVRNRRWKGVMVGNVRGKNVVESDDGPVSWFTGSHYSSSFLL